MFRLLATTKCKRQQIAILIISFFAYVSGIRNEGNNMLLQQKNILQQQQTTVGNSNNESPITDIVQQTTLNFRPSQVIDFTPADAALPQQFKPTYTEGQHSTNNNIAIHYNNKNNNNNINNNILQKQETQNVNRRYTSETASTYGNAAEKPFSFPNEQQQMPQHLTDKPIYIYRDPFTNENYHYTPTETDVKRTTMPTTYSHNNYNNNAYKQQNSHHYLQHDDNQEYLVQSSMIVGTHHQQHQHQQQQQQQHQQENNPFRPFMSLSADKDVYLKRPGLVYDETPSYNHPNTVIDKKTEDVKGLKVNKISYDSHDYPPPSYFQQQTSNFLPTPVPSQPPTLRPVIRPISPPTSPPRQDARPPLPLQSKIFGQRRPQQQYLQTSPSMLPNYANSIDNYLLNKKQTSDYYRTEGPPPLYSQQQSQIQHQYENRPASFQYSPPSYEQQHQYFSRPSYNSADVPYTHYETAKPPPGRPSYNNYYDYQVGEIPPKTHIPSAPSQQFNYPYPRPPTQYPFQRPYRPQPTTQQQQQQQQSGLATLAQYAPQFTSLLLGGVGSGGGGSNTNSPLGSLIGALTGAATSQQSPSSSSYSSPYNRRPVNSQLIKALENIARNDDLQCVPKVLCQMIAAQTQRGQLPTFITSPAITNYLAGFPAASPALIYGRAALLGLSGGEKSCHQTYVKCPKDEYEIIYYLNNHRGGFFKFFSEPEEQHQTVNHDSTQQGATSLFSILSALTGSTAVTTTTPRPTPKPQEPLADITSGIGNFFTQLLSDYMGGPSVEYQRSFNRRTKRFLDDKIKFESENEENHKEMIKFQNESEESQRDIFKFKDVDYDVDDVSQADNEEDFYDEEDDEDTQQGATYTYKNDEEEYLQNTNGRILYRGKRIKFFPQEKNETSEIENDEELKQVIKKFNDYNREAKLKFPTATDERLYVDTSYRKTRQARIINDGLILNKQNYGHQYTNYLENSLQDFQKDNNRIKFIDDDERQSQTLYSHYLKSPKNLKTNIVFPEREGKILNYPHYAASHLYDYLHQKQMEQADNKFVIPHDSKFPSTTSANVYYSHINSLNTQHSFSSNTAANNHIFVTSSTSNINSHSNHFLPTPPPLDKDYTSVNSIYSNNEYSNSPHNINNPQQNSYHTFYGDGDSHKHQNPQHYTSSVTDFRKYHSSRYTTKRPYSGTPLQSTTKPDDKNIYVTNSRGVTEYYITPDGRKVYL